MNRESWCFETSLLFVLGVSVVLILAVVFIPPVEDLTLSLLTSDYVEDCNKIYGQGNWSEYGADFITFTLSSNHPVYFKDGHSYTCFKRGTTP